MANGAASGLPGGERELRKRRGRIREESFGAKETRVKTGGRERDLNWIEKSVWEISRDM
jgi:hypothetical protein